MPNKGDSGHAAPATRRSHAERTATTKAALLAAGRELFGEKGYAGAGREEIVARARVTRGALYHHFGDKRGLFRAVVEDVEKEVTAQVAAAADQAGPGDMRRSLIVGSMRFLDCSMDPAVRQIILLDAPAVLGWREWRDIHECHGLGLTKTALTVAMDSGAIHPQPVEPLAHMLLAALNEAAMLVAQSDDPDTTRAEVGVTVERLFDAL
jgi:AcrR family transcriptional regulator